MEVAFGFGVGEEVPEFAEELVDGPDLLFGHGHVRFAPGLVIHRVNVAVQHVGQEFDMVPFGFADLQQDFVLLPFQFLLPGLQLLLFLLQFGVFPDGFPFTPEQFLFSVVVRFLSLRFGGLFPLVFRGQAVCLCCPVFCVSLFWFVVWFVFRFVACFVICLDCCVLCAGRWVGLFVLFSLFFFLHGVVVEFPPGVEEVKVVVVGLHHAGQEAGSVGADDHLSVAGLFCFLVIVAFKDQLNVSVFSC